MKRFFFKNDIVILVIIVAAGSAMRIYGLGWSLPEIYEEATPLIKAWEIAPWSNATSLMIREVRLPVEFFWKKLNDKLCICV